MINANTSPGRRVTPTCVAEDQQGRHRQGAQLVGPPRELVHQCLRLGRDLVEVRGVGSDRVTGIAHRLEVGRGRHAVVVEWRALPARRAVGVRRGDDQLADPGGRAERDRVRDETAEAETNRSASALPRWSSSATMSPASASIVIGRPVSAVCPWP